MGGSEDGYATPAAAIIAMALAAVAIAFVTTSASQARLVRAEWSRDQSEQRLNGAHNLALLTIATSLRSPPYQWRVSTLSHDFSIIAEPENPKLDLAAGDALDDDLLARLGVTDPQGLRARLAGMRVATDLAWPADASSAAGWRACAASLLSLYGAAAATRPLVYSAPEAGNDLSRWRAGELWRVRVSDTNGWRDERIVRFTGNGLNPAVVVGRRFTREEKDPLSCETLLAGA